MAVPAQQNPLELFFFPFASFLRNWDYRPATRWFENFITVNWNSQDADIEQHVLGEVGSYGLQLSRVIDALELLVGELDLARLTPDEQKIVVRLQDLARAADRAGDEHRGRVGATPRAPRTHALPRIGEAGDGAPQHS